MERFAVVLALVAALQGASPALAAIQQLAPDAAAPAAPDAAALRTADELLDASGLGHQLERVAVRIKADVARARAASPEIAAAIERAAARHLDGDRLTAGARRALARRIEPTAAAAALAWFRSPLARRVVALEREALEPARASEFEVFAAGLVANRPSEWRLSLLARLDAAGLATETSLDLALAVLGSLARARDPQAPPARIAQGLLELRDRMSWRVRQATLLGMLFAYRGLADEELERLVGFVESDAGQWFVNATSEVIVRALAAAAGTRER
ncbi:MAG: hypothetical protein HY615_08870 [Candidatus Rokubacteria bacterium]|nr:hypothetical protein [Candidatus Rokubacteria bacterium]